MISSIGEIWWLNSSRTVGGMVSGPAALWGFRLDRIFWIPVAEMMMSGMDEYGLGPLFVQRSGLFIYYYLYILLSFVLLQLTWPIIQYTYATDSRIILLNICFQCDDVPCVI